MTSRQTGPAARSLARSLGVPLVALVCCGLGAQGPERPQEVEVPGLGIMLKAGWQLLFHDRCRFAVPVSWHPDLDEAFARAPDGSTFSIEMLKVTSWSAHKAEMRAAFSRARVIHDESDRRLWLEADDGARVRHYIAVADNASVCAGWLEMRVGSSWNTKDTVKRVADSIGLAPDTWPAEEK
jgi:hypothetical protein